MSTVYFTEKKIAGWLLCIIALIFVWLLRKHEINEKITHYIPPETIKTIVTTNNNVYTIQADELFLTQDMLTVATSGTHMLRPYIIRQLIGHNFDNFITIPYASGNQILTSQSMGSGYMLLQNITQEDDLDRWLQTQSFSGTSFITIPETIWSERTGLYLFKTTEDLQQMGYHVVSHRKRVNKDNDARRFNIMQSFKLMGNIRIIMPGEQVQFLETAQYDEYERKNYQIGYAIVDGEEEKEYGGGICGASTAIYQGILTNTGLEITKRREHTKRFTHLYTADINYQTITTPGIDSAIRYGLIDLRMTNTTSHPIILVMNYDGSEGGSEEVFTLSMPTTQGSFEFLRGGSRRKDKEVENPDGTGNIIEQVRTGCYTWLINGEERRSCYNEIR